jgi:hypothetical protein
MVRICPVESLSEKVPIVTGLSLDTESSLELRGLPQPKIRNINKIPALIIDNLTVFIIVPP